METIVVTKHAALVELLQDWGLVRDDVQVIEHATPEDVRGKHVIGVLPYRLARLALFVTEIPLNVTREDRDKELTIERLREIAEPPQSYRVLGGKIDYDPTYDTLAFITPYEELYPKVNDEQDLSIWVTSQDDLVMTPVYPHE